MPSPYQERILKALYWALKPLVQSLLRVGIGFREFSDIAKAVFVQVATDDYGLRGRPTNVSRVAVMTGLTRKEIKRLREQSPEDADEVSVRKSPGSQILHYWYTEPEFLTAENVPRPLQFEGDTSSFAMLVQRGVGDIPPGALRAELKRVGAITELEDGSLLPLRRHFVPQDVDDRLEMGLQFGLRCLAETVAHNSNSARKGGPWFERQVHTAEIDPDSLPNFREALVSKLEEFSEELDNALVNREKQSAPGTRDDEREIGVGIYYFELNP